MSSKVIEDLHFQPWISAEYEGNPGGKLLLLGAWHYVEDNNEEDLLTCKHLLCI